MKKRKFYIIAVILIIAAIISQSTALGYFSESTQALIRSIIAPEPEKAPYQREHESYHDIGSALTRLGFMLALFGFISWIISVRYKENARQSIPILLFIVYGIIGYILIT